MKPVVDENEWKDKLRVVAVGYGEKRSRRSQFVLEDTIWKKATQKAAREGVSLNECVNQLLYIWSKSEVLESVVEQKDSADTGSQLNLLDDIKGDK